MSRELRGSVTLFFFKSTIYYTGLVGRPWQIKCIYLDNESVTLSCITNLFLEELRASQDLYSHAAFSPT